MGFVWSGYVPQQTTIQELEEQGLKMGGVGTNFTFTTFQILTLHSTILERSRVQVAPSSSLSIFSTVALC